MTFNNIFSTSIPQRIQNTVILPYDFFTEGGRVIRAVSSGIVFTALSFLMLGKFNFFNEKATTALLESEDLVRCTIYKPLMMVINPNFSIQSPEKTDNSGVITERIARPIFKVLDDYSSTSGCFARNVVPRVGYLIGALVLTVTRMVDFALGVFAALASIVTLGTNQKVNSFAMQHLRATVLISDLCICIRGVMNPQQFNSQ